jgi:hypothetical protein
MRGGEEAFFAPVRASTGSHLKAYPNFSDCFKQSVLGNWSILKVDFGHGSATVIGDRYVFIM